MADTGAVRVLVVDEDVHVRNFLASLFTRLGYVTAQAGSTGDALARLGSAHFALILAEHCPPQTDGLTVLRAAQKASPPAIRILISAFVPDPELRSEARSVAHAILLKPFQLDALTAFLESVGLPARLQNGSDANRERQVRGQ